MPSQASTDSEVMFERFCTQASVRFRRIAEEDAPTPDYELSLLQTVITEVKEITRNREEEESDRLLKETGRGLVLSSTPGDRVRKKISEASPQIKARCNGIHPGLLVLYDQGFVCGHLDPYEIRVAMCGLEQVHIALPPLGSGQRPYSTGTSYGPKRKMTEDCNTSISAIAVLANPGPNQVVLHVYHNRFAAIPLEPKTFAAIAQYQFRLEEEEAGRTAQWVEIPCA